MVRVDTAEYWDEQAASFDDQADHGLTDPDVRRSWAHLLTPLLNPRSLIADLGCGTGSLAVLLAESGHRVLGVDLSPRMVSIATAKAEQAAVPVTFAVGDAAKPPCRPHVFDVVLCRHVMWAMSDPDSTLEKWIGLLRPEGQLVLIEGRWWTGAGSTAQDMRQLVLRQREHTQVITLDDPALWGSPTTDERFMLISRA